MAEENGLHKVWRAPKKTDGQTALLANYLRHDVIRMLSQAKSGHPGGSLSSSDIIAALFTSGAMNFDPENPKWEGRDHFLLSKGHAAPVLYALYHQLGWITDADLMTLRQLGSKLQGHPDNQALQGIDVCAGSLGQGLSVAAGEALGFLLDAQNAVSGNVSGDAQNPTHVFVLLGDGEMQEGSNWEALMFAAHQKLTNLTGILDLNNLQIDGFVSEVNSLGDIDAKIKAFGWNVLHVRGHEVAEIKDALVKARAMTNAPTMIICDTIKGKGVSFMENQAKWHGVAPSPEEAEKAIEELDQEKVNIEKEYGVTDADVPFATMVK